MKFVIKIDDLYYNGKTYDYKGEVYADKTSKKKAMRYNSYITVCKVRHDLVVQCANVSSAQIEEVEE